MSHNQTNFSWRDDPRLNQLDANKLRFLDEYAARVSSLPQNKRLPFLIAMQKEAAHKNMQFNNEETLLLISVLSGSLTPQQKKSVELFQKIRGLS